MVHITLILTKRVEKINYFYFLVVKVPRFGKLDTYPYLSLGVNNNIYIN